jgi:hypothetical protein
MSSERYFLSLLPPLGHHLSSLCLYRGGLGGRSTSNRRPPAVYQLASGPSVPPLLPPIGLDIQQIAELYRLENRPTVFRRTGCSIGSLHRFDRPICGEWRFPCFSEWWSQQRLATWRFAGNAQMRRARAASATEIIRVRLQKRRVSQYGHAGYRWRLRTNSRALLVSNAPSTA